MECRVHLHNGKGSKPEENEKIKEAECLKVYDGTAASPEALIYMWCCICKRDKLPMGLIGNACNCGHVQCLDCREDCGRRPDCPHCPENIPPSPPGPPPPPDTNAKETCGEETDRELKCQSRSVCQECCNDIVSSCWNDQIKICRECENKYRDTLPCTLRDTADLGDSAPAVLGPSVGGGYQ